MANKRPWRAHYTIDWRTDPFVRSLDLEARMVYFELLDIAWDEGGLRAEWLESGAFVAHEIGIGRAKFRRIFGRISAKFREISPGILSNFRLESERKLADLSSEKQSNRAKHKWSSHAAAVHEPLAAAMPALSPHYTSTDQKNLSLIPVESEQKLDFDAIYSRYPRKRGKEKGLDRCRSQIRTPATYEELRRAVENYRADCERRRTAPEYIKHFDGFMNGYWRDWIAPQADAEVKSVTASLLAKTVVPGR